jgi:hypothetical protein
MAPPDPKKGSDSNKSQSSRPTRTGTQRKGTESTPEERQARRQERKAALAAQQQAQTTTTGEMPRAAVTTGETDRTRTYDRKRERDKREQRQRATWIIIGVVVAVLFVAFMFFVSTRPADAPIPTDTASRYDGLTTTRTDQGYARLSRPDTIRASVQVALYCDFVAEGCRTFHDQVLDQVLSRVRNEDVAFTFVPLKSNIGNSEGATRAAVCAADQGKFWAMTDALYNWLGLYGQVQAYTNNRILTGVTNLGLNRADFDGCIAGDRPSDIINTATTEGSGLTNFKGAPAFAVNGVLVTDKDNNTVVDADSVLAAIDRTLAQVKAAQSTPEATAAATSEATSEATAESTTSAATTATVEALPVVTATSESTPAATVEAVPLAVTEAPTAESTASN